MSKSTPSGRQSDAAELMAHKETDDAVVRYFKQLGQAFLDRWRVLIVVTVVIAVTVIIVAYNVNDAKTRARTEWNELLKANTVVEMETRLAMAKDRDIEPYAYLRLIEKLQSGGDTSKPMTASERHLRLIGLIKNFGDKFRRDEKWKAAADRLDLQLALLERDKALLDKGGVQTQGTPAVTVPAKPAATVIKPGDKSNPILVLTTGQGNIRFELFEDTAPNTVANILYLAQNGFYDLDGPGSTIEQAEHPRDPWQRVIGDFPPQPPPPQPSGSRFQMPNEKEVDTQRVSRVAQKWSRQMGQRNIGYSIRGELSAVQAEVPPGSLVMKAQMGGFGPKFDSASTAFYVTLSRNPEYENKFVVFGKVADEASLALLRRLPEDTPIKSAYAERVRPALRARTVVQRRLDEKGQEVFDEVAPDFVVKGEDGRLLMAFSADTAEFIRLHPGQLEQIPAKSWYFDAAGEKKQAGDKPIQISHHAADALTRLDKPSRAWPPLGSLAGAGFAAAVPQLGWSLDVKLLPVYVLDLDDKGEAKPKAMQPRVRYQSWPTEIPALAVTETPPAVAPLQLFPTPGGAPAGMPGGEPGFSREEMERRIREMTNGAGGQ